MTFVFEKMVFKKFTIRDLWIWEKCLQKTSLKLKIIAWWVSMVNIYGEFYDKHSNIYNKRLDIIFRSEISCEIKISISKKNKFGNHRNPRRISGWNCVFIFVQ